MKPLEPRREGLKTHPGTRRAALAAALLAALALPGMAQAHDRHGQRGAFPGPVYQLAPRTVYVLPPGTRVVQSVDRHRGGHRSDWHRHDYRQPVVVAPRWHAPAATIQYRETVWPQAGPSGGVAVIRW